ncbi:MAG: secretin and TonB N-terminal domain-containing protein [Smithellaceae bacterium]
MIKYTSNIFVALIITLQTFVCIPAAVADAADQGKAKNIVAETGYLENVILEKLPGKERIALIVSQQPIVSVESQTDGSLFVKLEDTFVPENLRRTFGENALNNITQVIPVQRSIEGKQWVYLTVNIKEAVPYAVKQEGKIIYIDFNVSALPENKTSVSPASSGGVTPAKKETIRYTDKLISLDLQDADIKSVLRLMAEYGNMSIVSGEDVKGNVTLTMKNVPWEQALDTILDVNGLAKKKMGDVISVMSLDRKKKDENDRDSAEKAQTKAEDERKARELKLLADKGLLKQILIEAKIVEATEDFVRNLGVQWGFGTKQAVSGGDYGLGIAGGSNTLATRTYSQNYPSQIPVFSGTTSAQMAAVNFPASTLTTASPTLGVVFGGAAAFLEVQLAALESTTSGKIISAPKVVTMEGIKATIKQGDDVPYVTPGSGTNPPTVTFKEALLKLEVTPKITDEGKISMSIKASNDVPNYALASTLQGNPPIRKNEVDSTVVIKDGDTVVIGGILKTQDDKIVSGLPWLQKIPVLGWLFKSDSTSKQKRQLLIFVTPKILQGSGFPESAEKIIN